VSTPGLDARPVQLHIMHFWGGGLDRWVRDFGRADDGATNLILATYRIGEGGGQRLVLYSDPAAMIPIRVWDIARPIRSTAPSSLEYRRILEQVVREFGVEAIIVSSLIGHALEALAQPVKTVVVCHDLYPICQAINPQFGKTCERCTLEDLRLCAQGNPLNNIFKDQSSDEWHEMRRLFVDRVLENRVELVVPSPWVGEELKRLEPRLSAVPIHVVPHGIDFDVAKLPVAPRDASGRLRVVVLGRLSLQKGAELLRAAAERLRPFADVTLVGGGKNGVKLAADCGWECIERYEIEALPGLLASIAPHAGVLASVVPETFSYTLSELWCLGIPPLATSLGSFRERIAEGETGFLFEPNADALVALVRRLHERPELLEGVTARLAASPHPRSTAQMLSGYRALIPLAVRAVARFEVGVGEQTALTEPYRHLTEAYASLTGAYNQASDAYGQSRAAYEHTRGELDRFQGAWDRWKQEFDALQAGKRWWLAPRAAWLVFQLPARIRNAIRRDRP
jgi:glycosyltransferase involved in cell wall biosynthesis